jgi:predicted nucleic acid-binding protein
VPLYLADTSAWWRASATRAVTERWERLLDGEAIAICGPIELELLYSARLVQLPLDERAAVLARRAQATLAASSQHRGPAPVDLLIAGVAEAAGATLLHYHRHFDAIAAVTGQDTEWVAPRGSLR